MRDHSHTPSDDSAVCLHCGQPLELAVPTYGARRANRTGVAVTVLLHLLLVAIYLFQPEHPEKHAAPPSGEAIVYLSPLPPKPKPKPQPQKQAPKKAVKSPPVKVQRLPDTITLPDEKPVEVVQAKPKPPQPEPEMDMAAYIEARRKQRGASTQAEQPAEESEAARGNRIAKANIAAANGRSVGEEDVPALFEVSNKSFSSADLKFRGWNPNFKRRWLTQTTVELGNEPDIETALVKKMIEMIRKETKGDYFLWIPDPPKQKIRMSSRVEDTAELQAFLFKEMFKDYRPAGR